MTIQETESLLRVLRQHGVARFERKESGALTVEFFPEQMPLFPEEAPSTEPVPPAPPTAEGQTAPAQTPGVPPRRTIAGVRQNDPLLDGLSRGGTQ